MKYLIIFVVSFILVYFFYLVTVILQSKKINKFKKSNQVMYFVNRYKLDINKIKMKRFMNTIALTNSFIVALAFTATFLNDNIYIGMVIGLIVLIPLMLISYDIIGKDLRKRERVCTMQKK